MPKIAFSTLGCPDWSWNDLLTYGPRYGYDGVEIRLVNREVDLLSIADFRPEMRERRRRELADANFAVCGLASSVRFDYPQQAQIDEQMTTGRAYIDLARDLGASFVRVFGDVLPAEKTSEDESYEETRCAALMQIAEGMNQLGDYAARANIEILLETHGDFANSRNVCDLFTHVCSPAVGLLWDTHHPWRFFGESVDDTFSRISGWIRHTHWKDSISLADDHAATHSDVAASKAHALMSGHRHADYVLFGEGEFPATDCMRLLASFGYTGWYCLEWEKMWHPEIADPEIAMPPFPEKIRQMCASAQPNA